MKKNPESSGPWELRTLGVANPESGEPWEWQTLGVANPGSCRPWEWWTATPLKTGKAGPENMSEGFYDFEGFHWFLCILRFYHRDGLILGERGLNPT